jgi:hypothetical protein
MSAADSVSACEVTLPGLQIFHHVATVPANDDQLASLRHLLLADRQ